MTDLGKGWAAEKPTIGSSYVASGLNARKTSLLAVLVRERERGREGVVVRDTTFGGGGKKLYLRFWRFPGSKGNAYDRRAAL
jgi:hypothetical protein